MSATATAIIPARLGSTRLPAKALAAETGLPMVVHVCQRAALANSVSKVVVATDAASIADAVRAHGFEAIMTSPAHPNGTSRLAEAAGVLGLGDDSMVVNVQGDEPEIDPALIDAALLLGDGHIGTIASPFSPGESPASSGIVKVVTGVVDQVTMTARALYFSRSLIPFDRDGIGSPAPLKHIGLYAYSVGVLRAYAALASTPLERCEQLEQLRALEHGWAITVAIRASTHHGVDTADDYAAFVARWKALHG